MLELSGIGLFAAFLAGAISFLSPCVLPLVPGYVSYVAGHSAGTGDLQVHGRRRKALGMSLFFVLGFSTVFMILGASATALGRMLLRAHPRNVTSRSKAAFGGRKPTESGSVSRRK